jgi:hypothetical protein
LSLTITSLLFLPLDSEIAPVEKEQLRSRLPMLLAEPDDMVASQAAVLLSRIARFDVPTRWPQLLEALLLVCMSQLVRGESRV